MLNLLIIGTGMYVCGRGTHGYGTVLPAIMQAYKAGLLAQVLVASGRGDSFLTFAGKLSQLRDALGTDLPYTPYPAEDTIDPTAYREALRNLRDPGAVIIVTPDHLHTEMALAAISARKHVLIVKPLAPTVAEAYQVIQAAERAGVYGAVEFHKRWDWANLRLRDALERGTIGHPLYFHVEYSQRKSMPTQVFSAWVERTTIFQYLGVHYVDIIHFVTRDQPRRVLAMGQHHWLASQGIPTYDAMQVIIEWSRGFVSTILTNWIDPERSSAMSQQAIKVIGTRGRLESDQTDRGVRVVSDQGGLEEVNPYFCQPYRDEDSGLTEYRGYGIESIRQFLRDVEAISQGRASKAEFEGRRPTLREALVSTAVIEASRLSLEHESQWVYFRDTLEPYLP